MDGEGEIRILGNFILDKNAILRHFTLLEVGKSFELVSSDPILFESIINLQASFDCKVMCLATKLGSFQGVV